MRKRVGDPNINKTADVRSPVWQEAYQLAMEQMHSNAVTTQNPIYAWQALQFCLWAQQTTCNAPGTNDAPISIPSWIARYLSDVSENICHLAVGLDIRVDPKIEEKRELALRSAQTIKELLHIVDCNPSKTVSVKKAPPLLGQALGLSRGRWSAFKLYASDQSDIAEYYKLMDLRAGGMTYEAAIRHLANIANRDSTVIRKDTQHGAKLVAEQLRHTSKTSSRQN